MLLTRQNNPAPLYGQLKELLKQQIRQQHQPHQRFASVRELVDRHGVSAITVTRALRELVSEGYLYARQGKGTFVAPEPEQPSRPAGLRRTMTISLPLDRPFDEMLAERGNIRRDYLRGLADVGSEYGVVVTFPLVPRGMSLEFIWDVLEDDNGPGAVLYGQEGQTFRQMLERAKRRRSPYVALQPERGLSQAEIAELGIHYVTMDQHGGMAQATEHLLSLGHRRIALLSHARTPHTRVEGFEDAMARARLAVEPALVDRTVEVDQPLEEQLKRLLAAGATAIAATSDYIALNVLRAAQAIGADVPGRFSLVGFDDNPDAAASVPPLTTVRVDRYEIGRQLALTMIRQFQHPENPGPHQTVLPTELVVRGSSGPAPQP